MGGIDTGIDDCDRNTTALVSHIPHRGRIYAGVAIVADARDCDVGGIIRARYYPADITGDLRNPEDHLIPHGCGWIYTRNLR